MMQASGIREKQQVQAFRYCCWFSGSGCPGVLFLVKRDNNLGFGMTHTGIAKNGSTDTAVFFALRSELMLEKTCNKSSFQALLSVMLVSRSGMSGTLISAQKVFCAAIFQPDG